MEKELHETYIAGGKFLKKINDIEKPWFRVVFFTVDIQALILTPIEYEPEQHKVQIIYPPRLGFSSDVIFKDAKEALYFFNNYSAKDLITDYNRFIQRQSRRQASIKK